MKVLPQISAFPIIFHLNKSFQPHLSLEFSTSSKYRYWWRKHDRNCVGIISVGRDLCVLGRHDVQVDIVVIIIVVILVVIDVGWKLMILLKILHLILILSNEICYIDLPTTFPTALKTDMTVHKKTIFREIRKELSLFYFVFWNSWTQLIKEWNKYRQTCKSYLRYSQDGSFCSWWATLGCRTSQR